ncbi:hypothetical protein H9P43_000517 [Blastocladiella emersonii ATCC 22665]|nr:hypothetical protein H9P43_000517 [Blastocladiella emersonii ATCC 22665]
MAAPPSRLTAYEETLLAKYRAPEVMAVMSVSFLLSTILVVLASYRTVRASNRFNWAVLSAVLAFFVNDAWYWGVIISSWMPNSFEIVRVYTPILCGAQVAALCFDRFQVFSATSYARWYTRRVRYALLALTYTVMVVAMVLLASTYWSLSSLREHIPARDLRKATIMFSAGFTAVSDLVITVLIAHIVLQIRASLDPVSSSSGRHASPMSVFSTIAGVASAHAEHKSASRRYRRVIMAVLMALAGMLLSSIIAMAVYAVSSGVFGHMLAYIFVRVYVLCAMVEWQMIVELVRDRKKSSPSSGTNAPRASTSRGPVSGSGAASNYVDSRSVPAMYPDAKPVQFQYQQYQQQQQQAQPPLSHQYHQTSYQLQHQQPYQPRAPAQPPATIDRPPPARTTSAQ